MLLLGISGCAFGHAFLDHAAPPVGSTLSAAPDRVRLWFTQQLEAQTQCRRISIERLRDRNTNQFVAVL